MLASCWCAMLMVVFTAAARALVTNASAMVTKSPVSVKAAMMASSLVLRVEIRKACFRSVDVPVSIAERSPSGRMLAETHSEGGIPRLLVSTESLKVVDHNAL